MSCNVAIMFSEGGEKSMDGWKVLCMGAWCTMQPRRCCIAKEDKINEPGAFCEFAARRIFAED